jgi:hypothetical protein
VSAGERECERSALVNEEIVYFIFQLELDAQLQRALNYEAYEAAQQIRAKRETVRVLCFATGTMFVLMATLQQLLAACMS